MAVSPIQSVLTQLGLSDKESAIYISCLRSGPSTVLELSRVSKVKRSTAYTIIEELLAKTLLRKEIRGVKEVFAAEDPERLAVLLQERRDKLISILPELKAIQKLEQSESVIKYYEGIEGVKSVYLEILRGVRPGDDYKVISNIERWYNLAPRFFDDFSKKRGKLPISVRLLLTPTSIAHQRKGKLKLPNEQIKILPAKTEITTNLVIVPGKVFIHQLENPVLGILIENHHVVKMHSEMFELIWNSIG